MSKTLLKVLLPVALILVIGFIALKFLKSQAERTDRLAGVPVIGEVLPDLELTELGGKKVKLSDLKAKVVVMNFWATWCEACVAEMPTLVKLQEAYKDKGLVLALITVDADAEKVVPPFLKKMGIGFRTFHDEGEKLSELFDVHGIPFTAVVNGNRKFLYREVGERDWNSPEVHKEVEKWLGDN
jgi:thiol-disulfide isomerase/thioredoxin